MSETSVLFFFVLLTAFLLADFVFKLALGAKKGRPWRVPVLGGIFMAAAACLLLGDWVNFSLPALIFILFFVAESLRQRIKKFNLVKLVLWIAAWLAAIFLVLLWYPPGLYAGSWWVSWLGMSYLKGLIVLAGFVFAVFPGSQLIGLALQPLQDEIRKANRKQNATLGLKEGGRWIGMLERALIYIFVLGGQYASIGFLVAAKSILRFGEVKESRNRMDAEYIIIGTLASFLFALLTGLAVNACL